MHSMKRLFSLQAWTAIILMIVGATTMGGWVMRNAPGVQVSPDFVGMVFSAAAGFTLIGVALILPICGVPSAAKAQTAIGKLLIVIAAIVLFGYVAGVHTPLDLPFLHDWLNDGNPVAGRMAPNTAFSFALTGAVFILMQRVRSKAVGGAIQIATFILLVLGFIGLAGYALRLELLYPWAPVRRIAIQSALCVIATGLGLWCQWHRDDWYRTQRYFRDDEKTGYVAATILTVIAMTAGIVGFSVQQATLGRTLTENLMAHLRNQTTLFRTAVQESQLDAESLAIRPRIIELVTTLNHDPGDTAANQQLRAVGHSILASRYSGVVFYDRSGRTLLRLGRFAHLPEIEVDLGMTTPTSLLWKDGVLINNRVPLHDGQEVVGAMAVEQSLPLVAEQLAQTEGFGKTGELGICTLQGETLSCFPQRRNPQVHSVPLLNNEGKLSPMGHATEGRTGIFQGVDYRGHTVIAAYGPLAQSGLGLVVKQDAEELYQPIREQLNWYLPLLLLLVVGGGMLLRSQVKPLVTQLLRSEHDAMTKELHIRTVVDNIAECIITLNEDGRIESFNRAASRIFGYPVEDATGMPITALMPPQMRPRHEEGMQRYLHGSSAHVVGMGNRELSALHRDGTIFPLELAVTEIRVDGRRLFVGIARDITERKQAEQKLAAESAKNATLLRTASDGIHVLDLDGNLVQANDAFCRMLGYSAEEMHGMNVLHWDPQWPAELLPEKQHQPHEKDILFETRLRRRDGSMVDVEVHVAGIMIDGKQLLYASARDISERKKAAEQMEHLAHFDILTDLPNRALLADRLKQALTKAKRYKYRLALLFIDLDKFKPVNDTFGHDVGDLLLKEVAHRLRSCLRESDTVARVGGDEFIVLLPQIDAEEYGVLVAEKILAELNTPFDIDGRTLDISGSIGVAVYPDDGTDEDELMKHADSAMYEAKQRRSSVVAFARLRQPIGTVTSN